MVNDSSGSLYGVLFGRLTRSVAIPVLVVSFLLPIDGMGVTICWIKRWFALPCPGCGLTRSITCVSQLEFLKSWEYHPFGFLIYGLFVANALLLFQTSTRKDRMESWFVRNDRSVRPIYWGVVTTFLVFGAIRLMTAWNSPGQ